MTTITPRTIFTPEDLLRLPDAVSYELVDGKLVERNIGMESSEIGMRVAALIAIFLRDHALGHLFGARAINAFPMRRTRFASPTSASFGPAGCKTTARRKATAPSTRT